MDTIKLLLAEDDVNLGKVLTTYLEAKGYSVQHANNGEEAYEFFCKSDFDICLIDVMMPLKDGFTLAKEIRKMDEQIPIVFLTAKNLQEDVIEGLSIGGDDYITKPFSMEVLLARLQALIRRISPDSGKNVQTLFQFGNSSFDANRQTLTIQGVEQKLTTRESELLLMLIQKKNEVLEREYVLKKIWGDDSYYNARSMDVYITKLRKHFKNEPSVQIINIHGIGFKLVM
ncbi:MAG TPA: response regulator transcription factor [Bacteroidales bacterium]|jgi:DNA-binding response OmpR family regulator|nr:response regulator transcription factor [Bacteroidales bacterium]HOF45600.1 response regulator transcription factor [Bacteroidales bacterium]HOS57151.1 response regulator transcription factor [Bacteroidales bacterium]HPY80328.1 response regulator transcription factor [Bacteroidales bacterium]HRT13007.1 response regulator transcription factor [Bacteroidales bacterium]